jgi:hypothetical protein
MSAQISIRNAKYFKPFDNTDNPCCWQVDLVSDDVDAILNHSDIDYEVIPGDWGTSFGWRDSNGVEHSMALTCVDVDTAEFAIEYWVIRMRWLGLKKDVLESTSDFELLIPEILKLNQEPNKSCKATSENVPS